MEPDGRALRYGRHARRRLPNYDVCRINTTQNLEAGKHYSLAKATG
ncbi:hypothetical protein O9929_10025 [Vibrio lentus]|nr:hypothetical protein [Vibrio lentus]